MRWVKRAGSRIGEVVGLAATLCVASCASREAPGARVTRPVSPPTAPQAARNSAPPTISAAPAVAHPQPTPPLGLDTVVAITDPGALALVERRGFTLGGLTVGQPASSAQALARLKGLSDVFDTVRADVRKTARSYPLAKVTSIYGHRLFDERWLSSPHMSYPLIGVFNRIDRRAFAPGTCGEVRFIYRLAYDVEQGESPMQGRLPMTINVVFLVEGEDCQPHARAWQGPLRKSPEELAQHLLTRGALAVEARQFWKLKSVETNVQTIRIQSSVHPTMAGHVDYGMRVFVRNGDGFIPGPMENMPDLARLERDSALRDELQAYLSRPEVLAAVDQGTLQLPVKFVTNGATSVSPRGLLRRANRPFRSLFEPADFAELDLSKTRTIRSPEALLRRLDEASCVGCHQSRAIAGFHHLGRDEPAADVLGALYFGSSDHLRGDLERRRQYVERLASGAEPDEFRPLPERQGLGDGHGSSCGLGDVGFAEWQCPEGLVCQKLEDDEVGACSTPGALGSPCEWGRMLPHARPHKDYVSRMSSHACPSGQSCDLNVQGFPLGFCAAGCQLEAPGATCGEFLDVDGYQACLRADQSAATCRERHVFRTGLHGCDEEHACRPDAVCVRTSQPGQGACVPPYFVFQLRLDGVPIE